MYLCDEHAACLVKKGILRPLSQVYGHGFTPSYPFKYTKCEFCGKEENCYLYEEANPEEVFKILSCSLNERS